MKRFLLTSLIGSLATLALAQTKINSATFGMMEARQLGPGTMSGRITSIKGVNNNPQTIYVGSAGGGIWKTTDGGSSFSPIFDKYCLSIGALAIDQSNPTTIYAGTGESNMRNSVSIGNGIYKSTDGGDNWNRLGLDSTEHIAEIQINPSNPSIVFAAVPGPLWSDSKHRGLYRSVDAGKTWEKVLYVSEKAGAADVEIDPINPNTVYATTWEFRRTPFSFSSGGPGSGIWKSQDGGKNWRRIQSGLPQGLMGRATLALAPSDPKNLVAVAELENDKTGLFISDDGGESWKPQSASFNVVSRPFYFACLEIDPQDAKRVYRPALSFSYSSDGGYSFADASNKGGWVHSDHHAIWINPKNTRELWLGTDGGVYFSLDRGASWSFKGNIPVGQFYHVATDDQEPYRIYGGLQDNGSWVAPSASPGGLTNAVWRDIYGGDGFWVVPDAKNSNFCYAESQGGNIARVDLRSGKSVGIKPRKMSGEDDLRWNWNTPIHVGPSSKALYCGAQYVYRSYDQGRNWTRISPDLTTNNKAKQKQEASGGISADNTSAENHCTIFTIAESSLDSNLIWVGTDDGNIHYTLDGGKVWSNVSGNYAGTGIPSGTWVSSIEPSSHSKSTVYATFDNHMFGDHHSYLARSTDLGKTWIRLYDAEEMLGYAHKIKEDPVNQNLLFLGTELGLYGSVNGGKEWFRMKNNVPWFVSVRDIAIQPSTNDLVLATHGRGVIVIDNIAPIRKLTPEMAQQSVVLFEPPTLELTNGRFGGGGFPSTGGWTAPNPPDIMPFGFYLKDRLMAGETNVRIFDLAGNLLQTIPAGKRKGINLVTWNMRLKPPKVAGGGTKLNYGGFVAPMVLPGKYRVELEVGDQKFNDTVAVVQSKNDAMSLEDRKLQYETSMKLYKLQEQLAALVDTIHATQKLVNDHVGELKNKKSKAMLLKYVEDLEIQRALLIPTKNKSIFADERRISTELSELFSDVAFNEQRPGNLQLNQVEDLQSQVANVEKAVKLLIEKNQKPALDAFQKENIYMGPKKPNTSIGTSG